MGHAGFDAIWRQSEARRFCNPMPSGVKAGRLVSSRRLVAQWIHRLGEGGRGE